MGPKMPCESWKRDEGVGGEVAFAESSRKRDQHGDGDRPVQRGRRGARPHMSAMAPKTSTMWST